MLVRHSLETATQHKHPFTWKSDMYHAQGAQMQCGLKMRYRGRRGVVVFCFFFVLNKNKKQKEKQIKTNKETKTIKNKQKTNHKKRQTKTTKKDKKKTKHNNTPPAPIPHFQTTLHLSTLGVVHGL
jgi:hypothetical protein